MKKIALTLATLFVFAPAGFAADQATAAQDKDNPMAGWVPRKVTREQQDRKEITALFTAMHQAGQKGDPAAAAELVDFPVLMVTDDSQGEAKSDMWGREKWVEVMTPHFKPKPNVKVTHKPTVFLLSDSLASVNDQWTMTVGKRTMTGRSATLLVRTAGQWRIKSMTEGGWGDMMKAKPGTASQAGEPSGTGTTGEPSELSEPSGPLNPREPKK